MAAARTDFMDELSNWSPRKCVETEREALNSS